MSLNDWIVENFFSRQVEKRAKEIAEERYKAAVQRLHAIYKDCTLEEFARCNALDRYDRRDAFTYSTVRKPDSVVKSEWIRHHAVELSRFVRIRETENGSEQAYIILGKPKEDAEE